MSPALRQALAPLRRPDGGLRLTVAGETCVLRPSGALWLPAHQALVAGDLHLEKGSAFAVGGQMLPPYDTRATLGRLAAEIAGLNPPRVVLLGDSFHDRHAVDRLDAGDRARLDALAAGRDWLWIEGNHDREALSPGDTAPSRLPGRVAEEIALGGLRLIHAPTPGLSTGEAAGHLHPAARVAAHGRGVRRPCFVTDGTRLLLPAFGAFAGGLSVRDPAIAGLFAAPPLVVLLGPDKVHAFDWNRVG